MGLYGLLVAARGAKWKWMDGLSAALRTGALGRAVLCRAGMWRASQPERREGLGVRAAWWVVIAAPSRERPESPFSFPRSWDPPRALLEACPHSSGPLRLLSSSPAALALPPSSTTHTLTHPHPPGCVSASALPLPLRLIPVLACCPLPVARHTPPACLAARVCSPGSLRSLAPLTPFALPTADLQPLRSGPRVFVTPLPLQRISRTTTPHSSLRLRLRLRPHPKSCDLRPRLRAHVRLCSTGS